LLLREFRRNSAINSHSAVGKSGCATDSLLVANGALCIHGFLARFQRPQHSHDRDTLPQLSIAGENNMSSKLWLPGQNNVNQLFLARFKLESIRALPTPPQEF